MSRKTTKRGGLGTDAFFSGAGANAAQQDGDAAPTEKEKKMRTTIMLPPEVVAGIETMRTQARKEGSRLTTSKIIEDALRMLMRERKINIQARPIFPPKNTIKSYDHNFV